MRPGSPDPALLGVQVAVLAKAPVAGYAKTRLIPQLGPAGAARLQRALTCRTLRTVMAAGLGPVTLWCAPDARHRPFPALQGATGAALILGAAAAEPKPAFSTMTATTMLGASIGAAAMYREWSRLRSSSFLAS